MSSETRADSWFRLFSPTIRFPETIRYPGGGDLGGFHFDPYTKWEAPAVYRGNGAVEQRVYREVASPGRQLGRLTDAVLELADRLVPPAATGGEEPVRIRALRELHEGVALIKRSVGENAEAHARESLEQLARCDRARLKALVEEYGRRADEG